LKERKAVKEALAKAEDFCKTASNTLGCPVVIVDNSAELYGALANKSAIGDLSAYYSQFAKVAAEAAKNPTVKEALVEKLNAAGGKLAIKLSNEKVQNYKWFDYNNDSVNFIVETQDFGSWVANNYNYDYLVACLKTEHQGVEMPLAAKRNIVENQPNIEAQLKNIATAIGAEKVEFDVNYGELYKFLDSSSDWSKDNAKYIGDHCLAYTVQMAKMLTAFCKDADNKEAVADAWSSKKLGFNMSTSADKPYFVWKDGSLLLTIVSREFGSWIGNNFTDSNLEATL